MLLATHAVGLHAQAAAKADGSPGSSSDDAGGGGGGQSEQRPDTIPGSEGRSNTRHDIEQGRQQVQPKLQLQPCRCAA
jgi:hypothetical protein